MKKSILVLVFVFVCVFSANTYADTTFKDPEVEELNNICMPVSDTYKTIWSLRLSGENASFVLGFFAGAGAYNRLVEKLVVRAYADSVPDSFKNTEVSVQIESEKKASGIYVTCMTNGLEQLGYKVR